MKILIKDSDGQTFIFRQFSSWHYVKDVKDALYDRLSIPVSHQRLFFAGQELKKNNGSLNDWHIKHGSVLFLCAKKKKSDMIQVFGGAPCPQPLYEQIAEARKGLNAGYKPRLTMEGTGGTYFLPNHRGHNVVVFKPMDEEPYAPHNPRGYVGQIGDPSLRDGIYSGEGNLREFAAYLIDRDGFLGVPMTTRVEMSSEHFRGRADQYLSEPTHIKLGSLQEFVPSQDVAGNYGPSLFSMQDVHKIAILDIRLVNTDRNDANILVQKKKYSHKVEKLIPIDHSYILPDKLEISSADWVWIGWPQSKMPVNQKTRDYIENIKIEDDIRLLREELSIGENCLRQMKATNMLLQKGIRAGLTLYDIACIICREYSVSSNLFDKPSELEIMFEQSLPYAQLVQNNVRLKSPMISSLGNSCNMRRSMSFSDTQSPLYSLGIPDMFFGNAQRNSISPRNTKEEKIIADDRRRSIDSEDPWLEERISDSQQRKEHINFSCLSDLMDSLIERKCNQGQSKTKTKSLIRGRSFVPALSPAFESLGFNEVDSLENFTLD